VLHDRGPAARVRRLLFVGQWLPAKGTRDLVEAFATLAGRADLELACVGTGASEAAVLADFPETVRGRVRVRPHVDRSELHAELAHADLFVFPSLSEGFSNALLEAMAASLPIVATPVGAAVICCATASTPPSCPRPMARLHGGIESLLPHADVRPTRRARDGASTRCAGERALRRTPDVRHGMAARGQRRRGREAVMSRAGRAGARRLRAGTSACSAIATADRPWHDCVRAPRRHRSERPRRARDRLRPR
jgi:hypothetical protein